MIDSKVYYDHEGNVVDIIITSSDETFSILGQEGPEREKNLVLRFISSINGKEGSFLPVLIGCGAGYALKEILEQTNIPIAVIDKEEIIPKKYFQAMLEDERVEWIDSKSIENTLRALTGWQTRHGGLPMFPIVNPFYLRLDKSWYEVIRQHVAASKQFNFWDKAIQPRFKRRDVHIILITTKYFIVGSLEEAFKQLGIQYRLIIVPDKGKGCIEFIEEFLKLVVTFTPDFVLTVNHFGVDKEGVLIGLLAKLKLPLASWFVDNPHLILHEYTNVVSKWTTIFTWDEDNVSSLKAMGYDTVFYLPLATSEDVFRPKQYTDKPVSGMFPADISFIGNSMVFKVEDRMASGSFCKELICHYKEIATAFVHSKEHSIQAFLQRQYPEIYDMYAALETIEQRLTYEAMLTWEATLQYRKMCVDQLLDFSPVIVGDSGWEQIIKTSKKWYYHSEVNYYTALPKVYIFSAINFNCTSMQMKGAVNQRVFDVPATNSFLLTDARRQMDALFEPKKEVISYSDPGEIKELLTYYLKYDRERTAIAQAARNRVLAQHTWKHRIKVILDKMEYIYG